MCRSLQASWPPQLLHQNSDQRGRGRGGERDLEGVLCHREGQHQRAAPLRYFREAPEHPEHVQHDGKLRRFAEQKFQGKEYTVRAFPAPDFSVYLEATGQQAKYLGHITDDNVIAWATDASTLLEMAVEDATAAVTAATRL